MSLKEHSDALRFFFTQLKPMDWTRCGFRKANEQGGSFKAASLLQLCKSRSLQLFTGHRPDHFSICEICCTTETNPLHWHDIDSWQSWQLIMTFSNKKFSASRPPTSCTIIPQCIVFSMLQTRDRSRPARLALCRCQFFTCVEEAPKGQPARHIVLIFKHIGMTLKLHLLNSLIAFASNHLECLWMVLVWRLKRCNFSAEFKVRPSRPQIAIQREKTFRLSDFLLAHEKFIIYSRIRLATCSSILAVQGSVTRNVSSIDMHVTWCHRTESPTITT